MSDRETMQQALEALESGLAFHAHSAVLQNLRTALEQQAEPVADGNKVICPACCHQFRAIPTSVQTLMLNAGFEPPFVTPPAAQRPWQGLTDEDVNRESAMIASQMKLAFHAGMYVAQQILKERNT